MSVLNFINYKQVVNSAMQDSQIQELVADFLNHCLKNCSETKELIRDIVREEIDLK